MKYFFWGLFIGLMVSTVTAQNLPNEDIEYPAYPSVVIVDDNSNYHILVDGASAVPNNSVHVANLDAKCLTGGKNCSYPLKVLRIQ